LFVHEWLDLIASLKRARWNEHDTSLLSVRSLLGIKVSALSLGQRQRVSLTSALMGHPPLLLLDEPTNAIDSTNRDALIDHLSDATAIIATHDRAFADAISARIVVMKSGVAFAA
jgi:ATPase subunit of ABC transporter with duplicated ATPase domains